MRRSTVKEQLSGTRLKFEPPRHSPPIIRIERRAAGGRIGNAVSRCSISPFSFSSSRAITSMRSNASTPRQLNPTCAESSQLRSEATASAAIKYGVTEAARKSAITGQRSTEELMGIPAVGYAYAWSCRYLSRDHTGGQKRRKMPAEVKPREPLIGDQRAGFKSLRSLHDFQRASGVGRTPRPTLCGRYDLCQADVFCLQALRPLLDHK
jgi:hypothetical protein